MYVAGFTTAFGAHAVAANLGVYTGRPGPAGPRRSATRAYRTGARPAPALAAANVGIALGRRGADLARAAAGMILTNDAAVGPQAFPTRH